INASNSTELLSVTGISTRAANITPGSIFLAAGLNPNRISPDPHAELDNINFASTSAIPEPGTYALLVGASALMMVSLRRRRR
ncbi:MAG: PEP-CTERM sorting domain-containing protein, partial [Rariglobus sp.]